MHVTLEAHFDTLRVDWALMSMVMLMLLVALTPSTAAWRREMRKDGLE